VPRELRLLGLVLAGSCLTLVVTGAFATAAGPHPGGSNVHRLGVALRSVDIHAGATAVFGCAFLFALGYLAARRRGTGLLLPAALALAAVLGLQVGIGEIQFHTGLPWWLVLVHVALAAAVWGGTVAFVTLLWRPPASFAHVSH
jgi:cytochrome c oxidase assembly protein subunit 15